MKYFVIGLGVMFLLLILMVGCGILNTAGWFAGRAVDVAKQQLDPAELLRKYELFKDESAQLDAKLASIHLKQHQVDALKKLPLDRTSREQLMIWEQELGGMEYSFNGLAADYNAQMAKINYAFTNIGSLPAGASTPLPREYKPYIEE